MRENEPGELPHEWFCMNMEVPELVVATRAANQIEHAAVNARREESHGTRGVEGSDGYVLGFKS